MSECIYPVSECIYPVSECIYPATPLINQLRELFDRIEKLEQSRDAGSYTHRQFAERLNKLEEHHTRQIDENRKISRRIEELEEKINDLINMPNVAWAKYNKSPHKCPVCDGFGKCKIRKEETDKVILYGNYSIERCISCEGKGVLWG